MKTHYIPIAAELSRIMSGEQTAFSVLIGDKYIINDDPDRYKLHGLSFGKDSGALFEDLRPEITPWISPIPLPYQPGSLIAIKEAWAYPTKEYINDFPEVFNSNTIIYKSDYFECDLRFVDCHWRPPVTMPKSAVRLWVRIESVECKRCQDVNTDDLKSMAFNGTLGYSPIWYDLYSELFINKFGQQAWEENHFGFINNFKIERV